MKIKDNIITADENKWLTNGSVYSKKIWLGVVDKPENWWEVDTNPDIEENI